MLKSVACSQSIASVRRDRWSARVCLGLGKGTATRAVAVYTCVWPLSILNVPWNRLQTLRVRVPPPCWNRVELYQPSCVTTYNMTTLVSAMCVNGIRARRSVAWILGHRV